MQARARKAIRNAALLAAGLFLAYLLFAWFGFEPLVKWALPRWIEQRSAHHLALGRVGLQPFSLAVEVQGLTLTEPDNKPLLTLDRLLIDLNPLGLFRRAYALDELRLTAPRLRFELRPEGGTNWQALLDALAGPPQDPPPEPQAPPRLLLALIALEGGHIDFADKRVEGGFQTYIGPLQAELRQLSTLPEDRGEHLLSARTGIGAQIRWKGTLALNPLAADGEIEIDALALDKLWPYMRSTLRMTPPQGQADLRLRYHAGYVERAFDLKLDGLELKLQQLALKGLDETQPAVALDALRLSGGRLDLRRREIGFAALEVAGGRLALELDAGDRPRILSWLAPAPPSEAPPAAPWKLKLDKLAIAKLGLHAHNRAFVEPLDIDVGELTLGLKAEALLGAEPQIRIDDLGLRLDGLRLSNKSSARPLLELASLGLDGGHLALAERELTLERVYAQGARLALVRDAQGGIGFIDALRRQPPPATPTPPAAAGPRWRYKIASIEAEASELSLRDESAQPAAGLTLAPLRAELREFSDDAKAGMPVKLDLSVREGGRFEAGGSLQAGGEAGELRFALSDLALAPAQPIIARYSALVLAGGQASARGRLQWQAGKPRLETSLTVSKLLLNEARSGERVLGWRQLSGPRLLLTPQRIDLGELNLEGLGAKLTIFKDRSSNVAQLLKPQEAAAASSSPPPPPPPPTQPAAAAAPAPQLALSRLRLSDGSVDFADLSLALPFGTRIGDLNGHLAGLSSQAGAVARLELEGKVGEFGLARASGQLRPQDPTGFTDIRLIFRNVEMNELTPYSATFAGRRIESGKLSLDLEYKIKQRQLAGDNQVIMDKLTLGAHVDSVSAVNLPLDLAIAILQDSEGKIDLGLPVSGSLDDPQFSYGALIGKALVNLLGKIVSAPFRALGAMLGIDADKLDRIAFDAGSSALLPPEREKLKNLSQLLAKRAGLAVAIHGDYSVQSDGEALKNLRLRRAVAQQNGRPLGEGEDPGPISTGEPATQQALEALYARRFGAEDLAALKQRHLQANPAPPPDSATGRFISKLSSAVKPAPKPLSAAEQQQLAGQGLHELLARRLLDDYAPDEAQLRAIGSARGEAIVRELSNRGVAAGRLRVEPPRAAEGEGAVVQAELKLDSKTAAPPASAASAVAAR
ncbi:DUF748 domain-containing protein [Roseateles violae]|uniref:DUF748 domain-containing protein n=1 Tax=Roseateles violae TaxID=3058042 RepID=A0ABT8DVM5_9BURK|nr:DUF748 domain-containing protein [Pelomonas sp. PFR6]MDN3922315.1 DUF748 domain-containing protein [Pelomonas sp. PFR6]